MKKKSLLSGTGLLVGAGIGAAVGLLLAPMRGRDLRSEVSRRARELGDEAQEGVQRLATRAREKSGELRGRALDAVAATPEASPEPVAVTPGGERVSPLADTADEAPAAPSVSDLREAEALPDMAPKGHDVLEGVTRDDLLSVYGIGPVTADRILKGRPYRHPQELVERGIIGLTTLGHLKRDILDKKKTA